MRYAFIAILWFIATGTITGCAQKNGSEVFDGSLSYIDLAYTQVPSRYESILTQVHADLTEASLPHEVKAVRKKLGDFKIMLDVFAYAMPRDGTPDRWKTLRELADDGYGDIGQFKDLFDTLDIELAEFDPETGTWSDGVHPEDIPYDTHKVTAARSIPLAWKAEFIDETRVEATKSYFQRVPSELTIRYKQELSRFFWGGVGYVPDSADNAGVIIRTLVKELLSVAKNDYETVKAIEELTEEANEIKFHDLRKRLRSSIKITAFFDGIFDSAIEEHPLHIYIDEVVDRYGKIHDRIVAQHHAVLEGDTTKAEKIKAEIAEQWEKLLEWQEETHVSAKIDEFATLVGP